MELITSDRELKASIEGSKRRNYGPLPDRERGVFEKRAPECVRESGARDRERKERERETERERERRESAQVCVRERR